jgi:transcriptional regulator of acetoin/glycerol metabolism
MIDRPEGASQVGPAITPAAGAGPKIEVDLPYKTAKGRWVEHFERTYLPALLDRCSGNVSKAAREAQMDRAYLFRLLRRYGLKR